MTTRTLLLDLDGTLVDSVPDLSAALNRLMQSRNLLEFSYTETAALVGDGAATLVERAFAARNAVQDSQALDDFLSDYGNHTAVGSRLYPGVPETLDRLRESGWRLAVCTNKPEAPARSLLAAFGIADRFDAVGGGDSFATRKPDPAHLLATLAAAGGIAATAIMAGDHRNDVAAAAGAGIPSIFCTWGYGSAAMAAGAAATAARFADLPAIADALTKAQP